MASNPTANPTGGSRRNFLLCLLLLVAILGVLFRQAMHPDFVVFSNDGPLGGLTAELNRMPGVLTGIWTDLNWLGGPYPTPSIGITTILRLVTTPLIFAKIFAPFSLLFVGLSGWFCFHRFKLSPIACVLGGLAITLNADFFATSCWGVCQQPIAFGWSLFALGALADLTSPHSWKWVSIAGFAVGECVIEAYDIGALFSVFVAAFVVVQALTSEGPPAKRIINGIGRLALVVVCAVFIAAAALSTLVGTQIKGVVGMSQDAETRAQRWSEATLASLPKKEVLGILVPGLFGFRGDTPEGGAYWGTAGSDPAWDSYLKSDRKGPPPGGTLHGGMGSNYAGALVILAIVWAVVQSLRGKNSTFSSAQRMLIWFFMGVALLSLLMMFGRFAPFYQFFYALPYASTIRNPAKFLHVLEWSLVILFGYGMHSLADRYLDKPLTGTRGWVAHWSAWWKSVAGFERKWVLGSFAGLGVAGLAWLIYASMRGQLEAYLAELLRLTSGMQIDPVAAADSARATVSFSLGQVGWALLFLSLSIGLVALIVSGYFAGKRARIAGFLLCGLLAIDLGWQNRHWVIMWNWKEKYLEAADNPVIDFLRLNAPEHRVSELPRWLPGAFRVPQQIAGAEGFLQQVYGTEWLQQIFQYHNIQSLTVVQMPRRPIEYEAFEQAFQFDYSTNGLPRIPRRWQLTNTRYFLSAAPLMNLLNQAFDPEQHRFKTRMLFEFYQTRAGGPILTRTNGTGPFALIEFTAALPRARLYTDWQVSAHDAARVKAWTDDIRKIFPPKFPIAADSLDTNDLATLEQLTRPSFDPERTVLLSEPINLAPTTNTTPGTVEYTRYAPKHITLKAKTEAPAVLLLNDKYDPNWQVLVDGKSASLLRCNYIMRGVQLPPGEHTVEFHYRPPTTFLYVSLAAVVLGVSLCFFLAFSSRSSVARTP